MWQLKLFGGFKLEGVDALSGRAAQRKRQALLALLGSGPSTQISRDKIVALLWPETDSDRARHQLASSLYDARQVLGDDAILATGDDLRLDPDLVRSDVREFEAAIEQADYERAAALRSGPFLDGFHVAGAPDFERWVDGERDRLDRLFSQALEKAAADCTTRGDDAAAARWLQQLVTHEPYNSRLALLYMDALARSGDVAGALRYGRTHELLMQQELGAAADPQIGAFLEELRSRPPRPVSAASAVVSVAPSEFVEHSPIEHASPKRPFLRPRVIGAAAVTALVIVALTLYARPNDPTERSLAVLPFSTISADADSTYIAEGVHEDLLAHLTKIPDLKVISRTSVMAYRDQERNLRDIARELGVAFIMEGSVRRDGNRIRVVAQLINARTDEHVWAETYDRELTNLFAIQNDIAREIARRLHTDEPATQSDLASQPTTVTEAYDEYLRARSMLYSTPLPEIDNPAVQKRLERAIRLDPNFALAYAELTRLHAGMHFTGLDPSPARAEASRRALVAATRLAPNRPETHLAAGYYYYWVERDYERALVELARARAQMPGSAEVLHVTGLVFRRRAQLDSAIHYLGQAALRDPARSLPYTYLAESLHRIGRFAEANRVYRQAIRLAPTDPFTLRNYGDMFVAWRGETDTLRAVLPRMSGLGLSRGGVQGARFRIAMLERDCSAAAASMQNGPEMIGLQESMLPRALYQAWAAECSGDAPQARRHYKEAERVARRIMTEHKPRAAAQMSLGHALVGLGRYNDGLAAARHAVRLIPYERDAIIGGVLTVELAAVYARAGKYDEALDLIERYDRRPFVFAPNDLRLNPRWDALREMPRFQALAGRDAIAR